MKTWVIYSIGFLAQLLFSGRLLVQWTLSEKAKKVITPSLFWQMSLLASFLLFIYGYLRDDFAIMLGQALTYYIYIRNLQLQGEWKKSSIFIRIFILIFPVFIAIYGFNNNKIDINYLFRNEAIPTWLIILGSVAQLIFTFRFIYQWMYSEKQKESVLPFGFWLLSLVGSILILAYAIIRREPVLLVGHIFGCVVYAKNLILINRQS